MKHLKPILFFAFLAISFGLNAQDIKTILTDKESPITYYGIDFTKAVLIGDANANPTDIISRQFAGINDLMVNESDKYDIAGALKRSEIPSNLSIVAKRNEKANPDKLLSADTEDYNKLQESDISSIIKSFNAEGKAGTGLLFIVDGMSKPNKKISVWATFFDIKTKKVLLTERLEGALGSGFSFRNYWATGLKKIIDNIKSKKYKEWTK